MSGNKCLESFGRSKAVTLPEGDQQRRVHVYLGFFFCVNHEKTFIYQ